MFLGRNSARWLVCLGLSVCCGCGRDSNQISISGKVTLDGESVQDGTVIFSGGKLAGSAGAPIKDGKYRLAQGTIEPGTYQVKIYQPHKTGKQIPTVPPGGMMDEVIESIPARYNLNSNLRVELTRGDNVHNFELTTEPKTGSK